MFFPNTTDKLQIITSAAAAIDVTAHWIDAAAATLVPSAAGRTLTAIASATTTDVVPVPGASTTKTLKRLTARNKDASASNDLTVVYDANGTDYEMYKVTLRAGETLEYIEGIGFFVMQNAALVDVTKIVASDVTNATTSFADITGLTHPLKSGVKYKVVACIFTTNDATTTGSRIGYNIGAAPTLALFGENGAVTNSVTALASGGGTATARDTAIVAQTTGQTATGLHMVQGMVQPSADGTFAMRCASEIAVASGMVVKAGSWMHIRQEG